MRKLFVSALLIGYSVFASAQRIEKSIIYFPFGTYSLTKDAVKTLDSITRANSRSVIDSIRIIAYCDSISDNKVNDLLSIKRCAAVKAYLLPKRFIDSSLIKITGFGKRKPLNNNSTEALRALNRRAEIFIYTWQPVAETTQKVASFADTIKTGGKFTLRNLNFIGGRHFLLAASFHVLDTLVNILKQHPSMEIEIQGYVCCISEGRDGTDFDTGDPYLSVARAKTVYDYLIEKGIDSTRLSYKGYGSKPLVPETSEEARATNRRVEIKVVKK